MADKPILTINVDTSQWDAFVESHRKFMAAMKDGAPVWHAAGAAISKVTGGGQADAFLSLKKAASSPILSGNNSVPKMLEKTSFETAKNWTSITKSVDKTSKGLAGISRFAIGFRAIGKDLLTGVGGAAAGLFGAATEAANSLAGKNASSRSLGLGVGREDAFNIDAKQFGLGSPDLQSVADAQADSTKWSPFLAAGFTPQQIQNTPPDELTWAFAQKASQQYGQWAKAGLPAGQLAQSYGFTDILSNGQLRTGSSYDNDAWTAQHSQFETDAARMAVDQGTADKGTAFKAGIAGDAQSVWNTFNSELVRNSTELKNLADAASGAASQFLKFAGPQVKGALDTLEGPPIPRSPTGVYPDTWQGGAAKAGYWMRDTANDISSGFQTLGNSMWGLVDPTRPGLRRQMMDNPPPLDPAYSSANAFTMPQKQAAFDPRVEKALPVIQHIEDASGNPRAVNPASGTKGLYQLTDENSKRFGVDPYDPAQSRMAAGTLLTEYLKKFNGDLAKSLAAFDGDTHISSDEKKFNGDWIRGAKPETLNYLDKAQKGGLELNLSAADREFIAAQLAAARAGNRAGQTAAATAAMPASSPQSSGGRIGLPPPVIVRIDNRTGADVTTSMAMIPQ